MGKALIGGKAKEPKHFTNVTSNQRVAGVRSHSTRSGIKDSFPVQEKVETPKNLLILAKH